MIILGARHDTAATIRTHLFVISANNGGSTFLRRALEANPAVWSLTGEGQHALGFAGPYTRGSGKALIWNATEDRRAEFADPEAYDWETSRRAWYFQARAQRADAPVFTTSAPPFLLQVDGLRRAFPDARFIFLTRDPLAAAEGIFRRAHAHVVHPGEDRVDLIAKHLIACLERQQRNIAAHGDVGVALRYEDMCADPAAAAAGIRALVPALEGFTLSGAVAVKGLYNEPLRDMNQAQINRLPQEVRVRLEAAFRAQNAALRAFGYGGGQ